jgi:mannose-6-phosphate isomerase
MFFAHSSPAAAASLDPATTFAETWMGTHPSCPSEVEEGGGCVKLSEYLKAKGEGLQAAQKQPEGYDGDLPYLFKVKHMRLVAFV